MSEAIDRLNEADACHDADAPRAAALLRDVDPAQLDTASWPRLAFLLNHVLGEKLGDWPDASARQQGLLHACGAGATVALWRQACAAARLAGDSDAETASTTGLAGAAGAPSEQAAHLVALAAVMFQVPGLPPREAAEAALDALLPLEAEPEWLEASELDASAAACCNNLSADLCERPLADLDLAPVRAAMSASASLAQRLWQRAGNWVHHERAWYQRAVVANTLGDPHPARAHALSGIALLDRHDEAGAEFVDRAFLDLELAHASLRLGLVGEAAAARAQAQSLAARFGDEALERWFASRTARLEALQRQ
jgi:hypothetical protein